MAASATTKPPAGSTRKRHPAVRVEQPPRTIIRDGKPVDISDLTGDDLYEAITHDEDRWDYNRLAAEAGRTVVRVRKWVMNAYAAARTGRAEDDKTFVQPDGHVGASPWWNAGRARRVLIQIGVMDRSGRMIPHKPGGRTPGSKDLGPRRWAQAPMRDTAADMYQEYLDLTTRKRPPLTDREARAALCERRRLAPNRVSLLITAAGDPNRKWESAEERDHAFDVYREYQELTVHQRAPLPDREARAELCKRHNLTRSQLARRIKTGQEQVDPAATVPAEQVDKEALRARLAELVAQKRAAGYSERGASERARTALSEETGLTRRQIAGYTAVTAAETEGNGG